MSLLDVLGSRAQRSAADARLLYGKLHRGLARVSAIKIVVAPVKASNGAAPAPAVASASTAPAPSPAVVVAPAPAAAASPPAPVPPPQPPPPPPPAPPVASSPPQPPVAVPKKAPGSAIRRSSPHFSAPSPADSSPPFPLRTGSREGSVVFGDRGASGARLHEARRLNKIAAFGVAVGILNLIGLIVAIVFAGSMLRAYSTNARTSEGSLKIDQRAWVGLSGTRLEQPYSKNRLGVEFTFENTGKTPAAVDGIDVNVAAVDTATNRHFEILTRHGAPRTIAPGAHESISVVEPKPLSDAGFAALVNGRARHDFIITVRYRDVFGDAHRTAICKAIVGPAAALSAADSLPSCTPSGMD